MVSRNKSLVIGELFINAEEVYAKDNIDDLRKLLYDISWALMNDEFLNDSDYESI